MSAENPLYWLGIIPLKSKLKKENKLVTNPPWKISRKVVQEISRKKRVFGGIKISQSESQKVKQISIILATIDKFGPINTSKIKDVSGLSWDSVTRTLKLFHMKKIVKLKQSKQKVNNEKIYLLNREKAIIYHENLLFHKMNTFEKIPKKKVLSFLEKWKFIKERLPRGWEEWHLKTKQGEEKISRLHHMKLLMFNYITGVYCKDCFEKGVVQKPKYKNGVEYCNNCLKEIIFQDNFFTKKGNTKNEKWEVKKQIFKIKKKYEKMYNSNV